MIKQARWKKVEYSRSQIIKAGKIIRDAKESSDDYKNAITIIDNWRVAHAFPLHIIYMHLRRLGSDCDDIVVAERIKRLDSIIGKLKREKNMNLWTMQDLGGCRVIVSDVDSVYQIAKRYEESRKRHLKKKWDDYIENPKQSGYRSLHVVYEYKSDHNLDYNKNMLIEIQFRTYLQHIWATAVETMGIFMNKAIKSGFGDDDLKRFFVLTSALIAFEEKSKSVPDTSEDIEEVRKELRQLNTKNNYLEFLEGIKVITRFDEEKNGNRSDGYCILSLNYKLKKLSIRRYLPSEIEQANEKYKYLENIRKDSSTDTVLVRVSSFAELKSAYPNYFYDISKFVDFVKKSIRYK